MNVYNELKGKIFFEFISELMIVDVNWIILSFDYSVYILVFKAMIKTTLPISFMIDLIVIYLSTLFP